MNTFELVLIHAIENGKNVRHSTAQLLLSIHGDAGIGACIVRGAGRNGVSKCQSLKSPLPYQ